MPHFVVNQAGKTSKLNNYVVFIYIFILDHIVGHLTKQDVVMQHWVPVHSDDRYDIFDMLAYVMRRHAIVLLSVQRQTNTKVNVPARLADSVG